MEKKHTQRENSNVGGEELTPLESDQVVWIRLISFKTLTTDVRVIGGRLERTFNLKCRALQMGEAKVKSHPLRMDLEYLVQVLRFHLAIKTSNGKIKS